VTTILQFYEGFITDGVHQAPPGAYFGAIGIGSVKKISEGSARLPSGFKIVRHDRDFVFRLGKIVRQHTTLHQSVVVAGSIPDRGHLNPATHGDLRLAGR
jgi:hypothetical protein